ncbi:hypothetical protein ACQRIU_006860 [Beauveria bassiana]
MAPTFLIAGATGTTGRAVVKTLSELLKTTNTTTFANYRILALTRSSSGAAAQQLAQLPGVEFARESTFHLAALHAGVEYVVRISTTAANMRPDCPAYYARAHWAVEALLSSPEFGRLRWISLQPNIFAQLALMPADAPIGIIDSDDVGILAAHLLVAEDVAPHNKAKYVLNGPENISGRQIVAMAEEYLGTKVDTVAYKDTSFIEDMAAQSNESRNVILSIKHAADTVWEGKCAIDTTSKDIFSVAAPKRTPAQVFKTLLGDSGIAV